MRSEKSRCSDSKWGFLAVLDADDVSAPTRFANQVRFLELHPEVGIVGGAACVVNEQGEPIGRKNPPISRWLLDATLKHWSPFVHSAVTMRHNTFQVLNGYREYFRYAQDYDLWLRAREICVLQNLPVVVVSVRRHRKQVSYEGAKRQALFSIIAKASAEARSRGTTDPVSNASELLDPGELAKVLGVARANELFAYAQVQMCLLRIDQRRFSDVMKDPEFLVLKANRNWAGVSRVWLRGLRNSRSPSEVIEILRGIPLSVMLLRESALTLLEKGTIEVDYRIHHTFSRFG